MTSSKKVGGPKTKKKFQKIFFNLDKVLWGVGKRLQCHKNSYLKNLVLYCLETALFVKRSQFSIPPSPVEDISMLLHR